MDSSTSPAEFVCVVVPPLVLHRVCCCAVSPDCPPYSATASPRTDPTSLYMDYPDSFGKLPMLTLQPDQEEKVHTPHGHMTVM